MTGGPSPTSKPVMLLLALLLRHSDVPVWSFPFTSYSDVTSLGTYVRDKRKEELHVSSSS